MDRSDTIKLIGETKTQDAYGVWKSEKTYKDVFANVSSTTQTEFFEGGRNGLNPEYRMTMFSGDYSGESMLEYRGKTYAIYRTYQSSTDTIELYVERKGGTNGKAEGNG